MARIPELGISGSCVGGRVEERYGIDQPMNKALLDYFRCPEACVDFALRGEICPGEGYFYFGPGLLCYGQSSVGYYAEDPANATCDLLYHVRQEGSTCLVPFDPTAVVENFQREHYLRSFRDHGPQKNGIAKRTMFTLYYAMRPHMGVSTRRHLQRLWLMGWKKKAFPCWPIDRSADQILEKLLVGSMRARGVDRIPFIWFWPDGYKSCAILTHDVEEAEGRDFCSGLMDINDSFGMKSSFQIIPEVRYAVSHAFLDGIHERGFEVNVHDLNHDGHLYDDREEFLRRAAKINRHAREFGATGFRAGVLYRNLDWYDAFEFSYDMSVPNVAHLDPQTGGCCSVMPYFIGDVLELPLTTTQDYSLFSILSEYSIDLWKRQIEIITAHYGLLSFNIHPDYVIEKRARETYRQLLAHLAQMRSAGQVWMTLPREVDRWWRERARMRIAGEEGNWRIEGPGQERARLAYASLSGDQLTYSIESKSRAASSLPESKQL